MTICTKDYALSYFKYKRLTSTREELTNKTLKRLKLELQVNASLVEIDLGGSNYNYLGLVLTDKEYMEILDTQPFIALTHLQPLVIPLNTTTIEAL